MRRTRHKTDHNQREIVKALQRVGYHVTDLAGVGQGVPDLLATKGNRAFLIEIKNPKGLNAFTPCQIEYYAAVNCPVYVIRTINDVESIVKGDLEPINNRRG